jgi:ribosomal protein S8
MVKDIEKFCKKIRKEFGKKSDAYSMGASKIVKEILDIIKSKK